MTTDFPSFVTNGALDVKIQLHGPKSAVTRQTPLTSLFLWFALDLYSVEKIKKKAKTGLLRDFDKADLHVVK